VYKEQAEGRREKREGRTEKGGASDTHNSSQTKEIYVIYHKAATTPSNDDIQIFSELMNILRITLSSYNRITSFALCGIKGYFVPALDFQRHVVAGNTHVCILPSLLPNLLLFFLPYLTFLG
jgi:hypothetical protein